MAAAAALQRSAVSFRRQGSSGLVWDDGFLSGELAQPRKSDAAGHDGIEIMDPRPRTQQPQPQKAEGAGASAAKKERRNKCTDNLCPATKSLPATKRRTSRPPRQSATTCGLCGILCGHPPPPPSAKMRKR